MDKFLCKAKDLKGKQVTGYPVKLINDNFYLLDETANIADLERGAASAVDEFYFTQVKPETIERI